MPAGRPPTYDPAVVVPYVCQELAKGIPLTVICRGGEELARKALMTDEHTRPDGMPTPQTIRLWQADNAEIDSAIARAREDGEHAIAEECLAIADTPQEGWEEKYERVMIDNPDDPDGEKVEEFVLVERKAGDMLQHRKLRIETRLKLLAKFNPKRWGDYQRIDHDVIGTLADDLNAARARAKAASDANEPES